MTHFLKISNEKVLKYFHRKEHGQDWNNVSVPRLTSYTAKE